ncbi:hypothetical protein MLD38_011247 [Melastoma candidum]|uniref:Uncharacterized protein n=1 Tax=Melastoma candidum TaxID=119954 RepID=A0ACB9R5Z0_9MYRT|nr:hypothetical protein MLD38_011247 [Melastoma candidum]
MTRGFGMDLSLKGIVVISQYLTVEFVLLWVAMSVNDIVTSGAKPLFFLDYFATNNLDVHLAEKQADCVLLGGETAEMPDFYTKGEYDITGFVVGIRKIQS